MAECVGGVGVQALTHGTLPWTAEGHTRTTLFCQPPVHFPPMHSPCANVDGCGYSIDAAAAAGWADKYMPRHEAWSREEDYFDPALVSHYPDVRIPPPRQPFPADCGSQALLVSCAPSHGCSSLCCGRVCAQGPSRHLLWSLMWLVSFLRR